MVILCCEIHQVCVLCEDMAGNTSLPMRTEVLAVYFGGKLQWNRVVCDGESFTMFIRRRLVVFALLISSFTPSFFSERSLRPQGSLPVPIKPDYQQSHNGDIQRLCLTPTFLLHLLLGVGLTALSFFTFLTLSLQLVYTGCTLLVTSLTPNSLPVHDHRYADVHNYT